MIGLIAGMLAAAWIAKEDFTTRTIPLYAFGLFALLGTLYQYQKVGLSFWQPFLINGGIVAFMLILVFIIYRIKSREGVMDRVLGWGDVVMLLCLGLWLDPTVFLYLYTLTTCGLVLGYAFLQRAGKLPPNHPIPLAGWLGLAFIAWGLLSFILPL